nr:tyrosine-protein phosphatase [Sphingomonas sp. CDS-1]
MTTGKKAEAATQSDIVAALADEIVNLRDFGGLPTEDGRRILTGRLFRSGHLAAVSEQGRALLDAQRFSVVADLRFAKEREEAPSTWPRDGSIDVFRIEGGEQSEGPHVAVLKSGALTAPDIDRFYTGFYRAIPFDPQFRPLFGAIMRRMADCDGATLIHCSVGKDRTGLLVALIQTALGVTRDAIVTDFMATRHAPGLMKMIPEIVERLESRLKQTVTVDIARKMLGVEEEYLRAAFAEIEQQCGSVETYLAQMGVDNGVRTALRDRLLA